MSKSQFKPTGEAVLSPVENRQRKEVVVAPYCDEQIQFTNSDGVIIPNVKYKLLLEDGSILEGSTDWSGKTSRIRTARPLAITEALLQITPSIRTCSCDNPTGAQMDEPGHSRATHDASQAIQSAQGSAEPKTVAHLAKKPRPPKKATAQVKIAIAAVKTSQRGVGTSCVTVKTPVGKSRPLTAGEIQLMRMIYKDSINYGKVKVCNYELFPLGLQRDDTAITPWGYIYYSDVEFRDDFSDDTCELNELQLFMHETVHIWQHNLGYPVALRGLDPGSMSYRYELAADRTLADYDMEQQGNLITDYWGFLAGNGTPLVIYEKQHAQHFELYKKVLARFIANPSDKRNLPSWVTRYHDKRDPPPKPQRPFVEGRSKF